ncbi:class I SAM-dependent methyltransferase [Corynebacterium hindlerae]|uniref:class I SAM-dependent methyltransferase n=1 Tax=Corynebacterium hindlerae TaxID=699041 RepID=UPI001AD690C9|nr:class I SAM-dependent methyltransferase [Corynebacterium hindlerae]QTH58859.1 class I SAM-dependent methyltransferase [Corynebacterium hindlerae]
MRTWNEIVAANPEHSENYARRWKNFQAEGKDIDGEARFLDALAPRGARILDAGCGTGRVGGVLAQRGHTVVGVDIDPVLIGYAQQDFPQQQWQVGDLALGEVPAGPFDIIFSAGNVMSFLAPAGRLPALQALAGQLAEDGRLVIGFGTDRGYHYRQFLQDCAEAGLTESLLLSTWDMKPFLPSSGFIVAVLERA